MDTSVSVDMVGLNGRVRSGGFNGAGESTLRGQVEESLENKRVVHMMDEEV